MSEWVVKRFWREACVSSAATGHSIALDGRPVKTPAKAALIVPTRALAEAIAAEWNAVAERLDPNLMPLTRSANAAIDKVARQRGEVAEMIAAYGDTDLLCYRATAPEELVQRQAEAWDPLLDWADSALGARLVAVGGVIHAPQAPAALANLRARVEGLDDFTLTALHDLVALSGSLVIGLAALEGWQTPEALWEISRVDEIWQAELWGADAEAERLSAIKREAFLHAHALFSLISGDSVWAQSRQSL